MNNDVCGTRQWQQLAQENEMNDKIKCPTCGGKKLVPDENVISMGKQPMIPCPKCQPEYELANKFCDARYAAPETIKKKQNKFREKISALFMDCNADINHSGEITQENNIRIWRLLEEACARLENAEAEKEAARDLWINAQTACKKHALRADKAEAEIKRLKHSIKLYIEFRNQYPHLREEMIEEISKLTGKKYEDGHLISSIRRDFEQALKDKDVESTDK